MLIVSLAAVAASCAKARPNVIGTPRCVSWDAEIAPLFAARCGSCHTGATAADGYDTSTYLGVLGNGIEPGPNVKAGDPASHLLAVLDPTTADEVHQPVSDVSPTVRSWVVDCQLSVVQSSIHRGGILDPTSSDFHGQLIRDHEYDFPLCQKCHGDDFAGGTSKVSCLTCHTQGPTACATCHGDLPTKGSHAWHLGGGPTKKGFACATCHLVPKAYTDVGHIFLADGSLDPPPVEVTLGAIAALTPAGEVRTGPPSYDPTTQACSNIYCHGATLGDGAATHTNPVWSAPGTGQADCGTCHGTPPDHGNTSAPAGTTACVACHPSVVDKDRKIIGTDKHVNGQVDFGDPAAGCAGCHGGKANAAPPPDLTGDTSRSAVGVGAHQAHLAGAARLRGPIACNECHRVPTDVSSPGHFSGHAAVDAVDLTVGAEVFPADPTVGVLAAAGGAVPRWDPATATCASVYCHGGGLVLGGDTKPGVERTPVWTAQGGLVCGVACHGLPPVRSPHLATMTLLDCATCHARTVDATGAVIISGAPGAETSAHLNGVIDVTK
jgi:predicted CxxxxCH...CXXCH cytochrome family protein